MAVAPLSPIVSLSLPSPSTRILPTATSSPSLASLPFVRGDRRRRISPGAGSVAVPPASAELREIYECCRTWRWRGFDVNFVVKGTGPALLLVHGFGASVGHWRRNIGVLSESYTVYAIDLLGFGASDKPAGFAYTMEVWAQLILDFLDEVVKKPAVLIGNSVGSLACVIAASANKTYCRIMVHILEEGT